MRLVRRPSPATVIACIALFVALGGVSYGFATGSIDTREIADNTVRSKDIRNNNILTRDLRNNDVRGIDVRNNTLRGRDIAPNSITDDQIDESKLAEVPSAGLLGGRPPASYAAAAQETVHLVGAADEPPFQSGFVAEGGDTLAPGFWRDSLGTVHLQGSVTGAGGTVFTLPDGYRPTGTVRFAVATETGSTSAVVDADGLVTLPESASLDGISFRP
jgi:hypothetical protein